jgi:hypothetical protein
MEEVKLCECGCGQPAPISPRTWKRRGYIKGQPRKFIKNHMLCGNKANNWKGGLHTQQNGYVLQLSKDHPNAHKTGYVLLHRLMAEKALGRFLQVGVEVHHHPDNSSPVLVICENHRYHRLLHQRYNAWKACGHASWRKCPYCKKYDDPQNMHVNGLGFYHQSCRTNYDRNARKIKPRGEWKDFLTGEPTA